jgi:hypothetical protein
LAVALLSFLKPKPKAKCPKPISTTYNGSEKIVQKSSPANPFPSPHFQPIPPPNHNLPGIHLTVYLKYGKYSTDIKGHGVWKIILS